MPRVPSPAAAHIGGLIAEQRTRLGLTQDQLAARSDIDSSNIRAYENGRAMPNLHSLMRIAGALDVEVAALLAGLELGMFPVAESDGRRRSG
jgi:transcriptional regulator with XRE-family HTH domain